MGKFISDLFSDSPNSSMMRLCLFICTLTACTVSILAIFFNKDLFAAATLISSLLVPVSGGKAIQKFAERRDLNNYKPEQKFERGDL